MNHHTENTNTQTYKQSGQLLEQADRIVIIPHRNPDGDAIGSALAAFKIFKNLGKKVKLISPNNFPNFLKWLPGAGEVIVASEEKEQAKLLIENAGLILMVDFNSLSRIKGLEDFVNQSKAKKILIDHHPDPKNFADIIISDTSVSSTAELLYEFFVKTRLDSFIDRDIAECLYTGIVTDTGSFSYNSSRPESFRIVAGLLSYSINKDKIHSHIYNNFSYKRMQLLGYCLHEKFVLIPEFNTGFISITQEELKRFDFIPGDTEGFVNYPLSVKGIVFSALFIEKKDIVKLSFRSSGSFATNDFSREHFDGGGHRNASGGECSLNMKDCLARFKELLPLYANELKKTEIDGD
ncbi:MAG: bifunctional oligoribonuclease/PAP phosphatase NrnA [Bacteroidota bacterium]|nr:bifunctional oligoribonuclease/PAP phosphatase NrnA [Bacteroidota bacterium]